MSIDAKYSAASISNAKTNVPGNGRSVAKHAHDSKSKPCERNITRSDKLQCASTTDYRAKWTASATTTDSRHASALDVYEWWECRGASTAVSDNFDNEFSCGKCASQLHSIHTKSPIANAFESRLSQESQQWHLFRDIRRIAKSNYSYAKRWTNARFDIETHCVATTALQCSPNENTTTDNNAFSKVDASPKAGLANGNCSLNADSLRFATRTNVCRSSLVCHIYSAEAPAINYPATPSKFIQVIAIVLRHAPINAK